MLRHPNISKGKSKVLLDCFAKTPTIVGMIVTIFRSRLRPEHEGEYQQLAPKIRQLAESMPGFVSFESFTALDGERVSIVEFADEASHNAWRERPEHRAAQKLGREKFYSEFRIQVCHVERDYGMTAKNS
jgi:heme-degrading monooxygenase HmoA